MTEKQIIQWKYQRYVKDYLRCVKSVDDGIGRVLDYLDENGLADNTVVIYSSDQGWYLGEHGWFDKRWMYEESLKTPLMVRWPGVVKAGSVRDEIVSNLDFAQTFLSLANVDIPKNMQGRSLEDLFRGREIDNWRQAFYYHYYENPGGHNVARHYGVTDGRYKLIHFYQLENEEIDDWELFDLEKDPEEMNSVYGSSEYAKIQKQKMNQLTRLRERYQVPEEDPAFERRRR